MNERGFSGIESESGFSSAPVSVKDTGEMRRIRELLPRDTDISGQDVREAGEQVDAYAREQREASDDRVKKTLINALRSGKLRVASLALCALAETGCAGMIGTGDRGLTWEQVEAEYPTWEGRPDIKDLPTYEEMRDELRDAIGEEALDIHVPVLMGDYVDSERAKRKQQEEMKGPFRVEGFEEKYGIPDNDLQRMFRETLPQSWTGAGAVASFGISQEPLTFNEEYGLHGAVDGVCRNGKGSEPATLLVGPEYHMSAGTPNVVIHEITHANDWERANVMTPEDRTTLLYLVHRRVASADHLRFSYVESINNEDRRIEHLKKCTEYWPMLMEEALSIPADDAAGWERGFRAMAFATMSHPQAEVSPESFGQQDLELVKWYLKKTDPDFKPWEAAQKRLELIRETMTKAYTERIDEALSGIESPALRTSLMNAFSGDVRPEMRLLSPAQAGVVQMQDGGAHMAQFSRSLTLKSAELRQRHSPRLSVAFGSAHELMLLMKDIRERHIQDLHDVRTSSHVKRLESLTQNLAVALRGCSAEDVSELERLMASYDALYRGQLFEGRSPAWVKVTVERLERNGKI